MTRDDVLRVLTRVVSEQLGLPEADVSVEKSFVRDLGADSLDLTELVMAIEDEFDIEVPDEQAERCTTVGEALDYLMTRENLMSYSFAHRVGAFEGQSENVATPVAQAATQAETPKAVNAIKVLKKQAKKLGVYDQMQGLIAVLESPSNDKDVTKKHIKSALKKIFKQ